MDIYVEYVDTKEKKDVNFLINIFVIKVHFLCYDSSFVQNIQTNAIFAMRYTDK